jgi:DNA-binding NtrC family response regulator
VKRDGLTIDAPTLRVAGLRDEPAATEPRDRHYVMVFLGESSSMFALPRSGPVLIGRSEEAKLKLDDHGVSRRHALITMDEGEARLSDLGSHNGVWVNQERLTASRVLISGDAITVGGATLVYHASRERPMGRRALDLGQLRQRLGEEAERADRFSRELAVVVLVFGTDGDRALAEVALGGLLRRCDIVGVDGAGGLVVLLPETEPAAAAVAAAALLAGLAGNAADCRAGYACYRVDGCDPESLLAGARAAAKAAAPGRAMAAAEACRVLTIAGVEVIVADPAMHRLFAFAERLAASDLPVLITGETGTGKELVAAAIHTLSRRRAGPFVVMSCAALPEHLLESELFGHGAGAFPGAMSERPGRLESAAGGTLFLDEIGELSPAAQAKLLRAIETRRVVRIGEVHERAIDLRIVAATHHPIDDEVQEGTFRRDLFFRLTGAKLWLPPLRDRPRELPLLAERFLAAARRQLGGRPMTIGPAAMRCLAEHPWPGNIRELRHLMEFVAAAYADDVLQPHHLAERIPAARAAEPEIAGVAPPAAAPIPAPAVTEPAPTAPTGEVPRFRPIDDEIRELEIQRMTAALEQTRGNQTRASELIGMPLRTFVNKLKRYGLAPDRRS